MQLNPGTLPMGGDLTGMLRETSSAPTVCEAVITRALLVIV